MYGAIVGDLVGSIFEYQQMREVTSIEVPSQMILKESFFSDDTILTVAILDAILHDQNYEYYLKEYGRRFVNYRPPVKEYFKTSFSPGFLKWMDGFSDGTSKGNGALMRISPVGYLFDTEQEVIHHATLATIPSHNSQEAIESAQKIALLIFYARQNLSKEQIIKKLNITLKYKPFQKFNTTCSDTIDNCLYALFTSDNFEDSVRKIVSYGADTDTNACIVGSMAEALYGMDDKWIEEANRKIPSQFVKILKHGYTKVKKY